MFLDLDEEALIDFRSFFFLPNLSVGPEKPWHPVFQQVHYGHLFLSFQIFANWWSTKVHVYHTCYGFGLSWVCLHHWQFLELLSITGLWFSLTALGLVMHRKPHSVNYKHWPLKIKLDSSLIIHMEVIRYPIFHKLWHAPVCHLVSFLLISMC